MFSGNRRPSLPTTSCVRRCVTPPESSGRCLTTWMTAREIPRMGRAVAADRLRAREGKNTTASALLQPRRTPPGERWYVWPIYKYNAPTPPARAPTRPHLLLPLLGLGRESTETRPCAAGWISSVLSRYRATFLRNPVPSAHCVEAFTPPQERRAHFSPSMPSGAGEKPRTGARANRSSGTCTARGDTEAKKCSLLFGFSSINPVPKQEYAVVLYSAGWKEAQAPGESNAAPLKSG